MQKAVYFYRRGVFVDCCTKGRRYVWFGSVDRDCRSNDFFECYFIMAGYADDMKRLYNNNKGLERRIGFMFEFKKPSGKQLFDIFEHQLKRHKWRSRRSDRCKMAEFFSCQKMPFGGGSTEQLIFHCKQIAVVRQFQEAHQKIITLQDLKEATKSMAENKRTIKNMPIGVKHMYL